MSDVAERLRRAAQDRDIYALRDLMRWDSWEVRDVYRYDVRPELSLSERELVERTARQENRRIL